MDMGSRLAVSLVAAAQVGPLVWGSWNLLNLIIRYGSLTHLGATNGLNRQYALETGRGNDKEAERLREASFGALIMSLFIAGGIVLAMSFGFAQSDIGLNIIFTLFLLLCHQLYSYVLAVHKSRIEFGAVSKMQLYNAFTLPIVAVPLTLLYGLPGYILGQAATYLVLVAVAWRADPGMFTFRIDWPRIGRLIRIGFPIMLVGVLFVLFSTVDRWVISSMISVTALGHYSLAIMALGAVALLPLTVAQQYYPRMARKWGQTANWQDLKALSRQQTVVSVIATSTVALVGWFAAPPLVKYFLPDYVPGIAALQITLMAPVLHSFGQSSANILNVVDRQYSYLAWLVGSIIINLVLSVWLAGIMGITGVGLATVLAYGAFSAGLLILAARSPKQPDTVNETSQM